MGRRVIERAQWKEFVDAFSRRHDGWLISVAIEEDAAGRWFVTRDAPLRGIVAEVDGGADTMMIFTGDTAPHATHFIARPVSLSVEETAQGADAELAVADDSGTRTIIAFRSPMLPELVDGIAR